VAQLRRLRQQFYVSTLYNRGQLRQEGVPISPIARTKRHIMEYNMQFSRTSEAVWSFNVPEYRHLERRIAGDAVGGVGLAATWFGYPPGALHLSCFLSLFFLLSLL
jgi:hypothetical protein